jgi:hypothetical protein
MGLVIPGSVQSNRDRADLIALRRLGMVDDCAKVVEFPDYIMGTLIPPLRTQRDAAVLGLDRHHVRR